MKALLLPLLFLLSSHSWAGLQPRLQWFDETGNSVEVNWNTRSKLVWKESRTADREHQLQLEVSVKLPAQIKVVSQDDPTVKVLDVPTDDENTNEGQVLNFVATGTTTTVKLTVNYVLENAQKKAGLLVTFETDAPVFVVHETCKKQGISLRSSSYSGKNLLYLGMTCSRVKDDLIAQFYVPSEITIADPINAIYGLKKQKFALDGESAKPHASGFKRIGEVSLVDKDKKTKLLDIDVMLKEQSDSKQPPNSDSENAQGEPSTSANDSAQFALSMGTTYFTYKNPVVDRPYPPSELGLDAAIRFFSSRYSTKKSLAEIELSGPLVTALPKPAFPSSGAYRLSGKWITSALIAGQHARYGVVPGLVIEKMHFREYSYTSDFLFGPQLALVLTHEGLGFMHGKVYELRLYGAPLFSTRTKLLYHGYQWGGFFSLEVNRISAQKRLDILLKIEHHEMREVESVKPSATQVTTGLQVWY